jgi:predicted P-loop ATPase
VRRIYVPGTKFDTMPILEGDQGSGKSTMLRLLAVRDDWFADGLPLGARAKEVIEQVEGCLIVEIQELVGLGHADVNKVKALLSRTHDKDRKSYGRFTTNLARQFVFFATTNPSEKGYLKDKTGNRRFWPIKVRNVADGGIDLDSLKRDRDQLWAEAVHRHRKGESLVLPRHLWDFATAEQEKRVTEHPWVAFLDERLGEMLGRVQVEDVWQLLGMHEGGRRLQYHVEDMASAMKKLGWEHKQLRKDGKRHYFYVRGAPPFPDIDVIAPKGEKPIVRYSRDKPKDEDREYY